MRPIPSGPANRKFTRGTTSTYALLPGNIPAIGLTMGKGVGRLGITLTLHPWGGTRPVTTSNIPLLPTNPDGSRSPTNTSLIWGIRHNGSTPYHGGTDTSAPRVAEPLFLYVFFEVQFFLCRNNFLRRARRLLRFSPRPCRRSLLIGPSNLLRSRARATLLSPSLGPVDGLPRCSGSGPSSER